MADSKTDKISFDVNEYLAQQQADASGRRRKKQKPTEFTVETPALPVLPTQGRAKKEGSAFQPGRSNLPNNVFGYKPDTRNPEDIVISKEDAKTR